MFSPRACERLGFYVYLYIDPRTNEPFYIGKGKSNRVFAHLKSPGESEKFRIVRELESLGLKARLEILKYGLTEKQALLVESTAIDLVDINKLTNEVHGHGSRFGSRGSVDEVASRLDAKPATITDPVLLINIARRYHDAMSPQELYDATRSAWKVGPDRHRATFAMCVFAGVIREVYEIAQWVPAGSTMQAADRDGRRALEPDQWEFVGKVAEERVTKRYVGRSVKRYVKPGTQNPIQYVNC